MKRLILLFTTFMMLALTACSMSAEARDNRAYYRPAVGWTIEKEQSREIKVDGQNELKLDVQDGNISLIPWEGDSLQIKETKRLKAPESRKSLERHISEYTTAYLDDPYEISISNKPPEKLKPFSRITTDFEIRIPSKLKILMIKAANGSIGLSGFDGVSMIDLELETGTIRVEQSNAYSFDLTVKRGDIIAEKLDGKSNLKLTYGNAELKNIKGEVMLKSISGRADLKDVEGRVDCNISKGSLNVSESFLKADSSLYASNGDISVDFSAIDKEGGYSFMTAAGNIRLDLPNTAGFMLKAESVKGKVVSDYKPSAEVKAAGGDQKLTLTVKTGGPSISLLVDKGNIFLRRKP